MSDVILSKQDIQKLSVSAQKEIINLLFKTNLQEFSEEDFGELTKKQVSDLIDGLSEKSRNVLKAVAEFNEHIINFNALLKLLKVDEKDIKGVWSGLTTRSRNISNDSEFYLIDWEWSEDQQSYLMNFNPKTYQYIVAYFQ